MDNEQNIIEVMFSMFENAKEVYGDELETFWFYDAETCPCCSGIEINVFSHNRQSYVSLNSYVYREMQVLIFYILCGNCFKQLPVITGMKKEDSYKNIEETLITAYNDYLSSIAS